MGSSEGRNHVSLSAATRAAADSESSADADDDPPVEAGADADDDPECGGETENGTGAGAEADLARWTGFTPDDPDDEPGPSPRSLSLSTPTLGRWTDADLSSAARAAPSPRGGGGPADAPLTTDTSSFGFRYIEAPAAKWTFDPDSVRRYVESHLRGRVLNLFAGRTRLRHDGEVVRNDLDETIDADHHFDAVEVADNFPPRSFDTVVLDPPYNVRKAREKYNGRYRGAFTVVKDRLIPLVKLGGRVVHFGYASTGMSRSRGFEKREVCLINHKGDHNDTICVVEERVEGALDSYAAAAAPDGDADDRSPVTTGDEAGVVPTVESADAATDGGDGR